jgi:peptidoglycan/xylan/chitin deacetylase (PgdA/CDA1 family)
VVLGRLRTRLLLALSAAALGVLGAALLAGVAAGAPKPSTKGRPLPIARTSFTQSGQQVVWNVQLATPFSSSGLAADHRTICLLLERAGNGSVAAQVCLAAPRKGSTTPQLAYSRVTRKGPGKAKIIPATISRASSSSLTATFMPSDAGLSYRPLRFQTISRLAAAQCLPSIRRPAGCVTLNPAKPAKVALHSPIPVGCVASGPSYVTNGSRSRKVIALTFDDGPWIDTTQFLDILEREHVPATFFEIGEQVSTYGQGGAVQRRMLADGDMIGDHTWSHPDVAGGGAFAEQQITSAAAAIKHASGFQPCLFRAPYGAVSPGLISLARSLGFITVEWDVDPTDWARPGTDTIYSRVTSMAQNGSIVLQHDGGGDRSETLAALPREIAFFKARGYQFVTVAQLLGLRLIYK